MESHLIRFDKTKTLVFADLETFNLCLSFDFNLPWQLGMVKVVGDNIIDQRDILVKWDTKLKISPDAARITGYDHNKVQRLGIRQEEAFAELFKWFEEADYIVGHNFLGFDSYLVKDWYKLNGKCWRGFMDKLIDTSNVAKGIKKGIMPAKGESMIEYLFKMDDLVEKGLKTRLSLLADEYGIIYDGSRLHDAIYDLELNVKVWNKMKYQINF